jgi:hypothetical protein
MSSNQFLEENFLAENRRGGLIKRWEEETDNRI